MKITLTRRGKGFAIMAVVLSALVAVPVPMYAVLGVEDTVEPGPGFISALGAQYATLGHIWEQDASTYTKVVEEVLQLEKIYANGIQMYNLGMAMSQAFSSNRKATFETLAQTAVTDYTQDKYGENGAWSSTLNGNPNQAAAAWKMATVALNQGVDLANETPGRSGSLARMASIEAMDGASTGCLQTLGQYHANTVQNALGPLVKLAVARLDGTSSTNSQIEQLNLVNAHQAQANNELMAQGQINACIAQQLVLQNKLQRDTQAEAFNTYAQMQQSLSSNPMQISTVGSLLDQ